MELVDDEPSSEDILDQARERFQPETAFERYIERVISYRVRRGEAIAKVAAEYGEVYLATEEFNQTDFRRSTGRHHSIPTATACKEGDAPCPGQVVDKDGRPLSDENVRHLVTSFAPIFGPSTLGHDDSNVFGGVGDNQYGSQDPLADFHLIPAVIGPGGSIQPASTAPALPLRCSCRPGSPWAHRSS